jgi:capsid protein
MINLCRDLERNSTSAKGILKQLKVNVVGTLAKLQFNSEDEELNEEVNAWFNSEWAPESDSRDDVHFTDQLKLTLASVIREGDCVLAFDLFDDGKLLYWEADQMVEINETDWKNQEDWTEVIIEDGKKKTVPLQQSSGVIYDSHGIVKAYAVSSKRGMLTVELKHATILPKGVAKLVKNPFRHNQLRGTGDFFAAIADIEDIYEMRAKELQSAKLAATFGGTITKEDAVDEAIFRGGVGPESLLETEDGAEEVTTNITNYETLETLTGGMLEYLLPDEKFEAADLNRPNIHVQEFFDFVLESSGAGFGMARAYTRLRADSSYTSFRGDMILTWPTFLEWQKFLERYVCDWVAKNVLEWAMKQKKISKLPVGWRGMFSWLFPVMPQVDPEKEGNAIDSAIKNGRTDFKKVLGPDWKKKLKGTGDGLTEAKNNNIPLSAFETKAGAIAEETTDGE